MRVVYLSESMDTSYGGPPNTIPEMVNALSQHKIETEIVSIRETNQPERNDLIDRYTITHYSCDTSFPHKIKYSRDLVKHSNAIANDNDRIPLIFHINNLWTWPPYYFARLAQEHNIPYVISTRGMLLDAARQKSRFAKDIAWKMFFKSIVNKASCIHATSSQELAELRIAGVTLPIALIPHGIRLFEPVSPDHKRTAKQRLELDPKAEYALFLARITEHKGLHILIEALDHLRNRLPDIRLLVAGEFSSEAYRKRIKCAIETTGLSNRIVSLGEVRGNEKDDAYRAAAMFVLPTRSENFGASIGEALSFGLPIVTTKTTPWSQLQSEEIGYLVDRNSAAIAKAILDISQWPTVRRAQIQSTAQKILSEYCWLERAKDMKSVYEWLVGISVAPACVDFPD